MLRNKKSLDSFDISLISNLTSILTWSATSSAFAKNSSLPTIFLDPSTGWEYFYSLVEQLGQVREREREIRAVWIWQRMVGIIAFTLDNSAQRSPSGLAPSAAPSALRLRRRRPLDPNERTLSTVSHSPHKSQHGVSTNSLSASHLASPKDYGRTPFTWNIWYLYWHVWTVVLNFWPMHYN